MFRNAILILGLACLGLLAPGCGSGCCDGGGAVGDGPPAALAPTFLLADVNTTSPSYQQLLSPRARLGSISAWYFGAAT